MDPLVAAFATAAIEDSEIDSTEPIDPHPRGAIPRPLQVTLPRQATTTVSQRPQNANQNVGNLGNEFDLLGPELGAFVSSQLQERLDNPGVVPRPSTSRQSSRNGTTSPKTPESPTDRKPTPKAPTIAPSSRVSPRNNIPPPKKPDTNDKTKETLEGMKKFFTSKGFIIGASTVACAGGAIVAAPFVVGAMGFTAAGIQAGSIAASMMSVMGGASTAAGSTVAICQAVGATGTVLGSAVATGAAVGTGATVGAAASGIAVAVSDSVKDKDAGSGSGSSQGKAAGNNAKNVTSKNKERKDIDAQKRAELAKQEEEETEALIRVLLEANPETRRMLLRVLLEPESGASGKLLRFLRELEAAEGKSNI